MALFLIRHTLTLPAVLDGHEWTISPEGERQAVADAPFWKSVHALYSSPEEKALATVRPASDKLGLEIQEDDRLREAHRPPRWYDDYDEVARRYLEDPENTP